MPRPVYQAGSLLMAATGSFCWRLGGMVGEGCHCNLTASLRTLAGRGFESSDLLEAMAVSVGGQSCIIKSANYFEISCVTPELVDNLSFAAFSASYNSAKAALLAGTLADDPVVNTDDGFDSSTDVIEMAGG